MKKFLTTTIILPLALTACNLVEVEQSPVEETTDTVEDIVNDLPVRETKNVAYEGEVQLAGISIYQQGSHRLVLPGGKFILLESDSVDLNGYVSEKVKIFGALRPTVEAGGMIMRVERIELAEPVADLPINEEQQNTVEEQPPEEEEPSVDPEETEPEELPTAEEEENEAAASQSSEETAEVIKEPTPEYLELIEVMARQDYSAENWTQQYCTSHIGFCAPVHRNWWFKSFGATNTTLWHVEFSAEPIDSLNQGPIVVDLVAGSIGDKDGTLDVSGGKAVGYKEWTFGRHFRIHGHDSLEEAVRYITDTITEYAQ